jgi:hypothetical protein
LKWIHITTGFEQVLVFVQQIRLKPFPKRQSATTNRAEGMKMASGRGRGYALLLVADLSHRRTISYSVWKKNTYKNRI